MVLDIGIIPTFILNVIGACTDILQKTRQGAITNEGLQSNKRWGRENVGAVSAKADGTAVIGNGDPFLRHAQHPPPGGDHRGRRSWYGTVAGSSALPPPLADDAHFGYHLLPAGASLPWMGFY